MAKKMTEVSAWKGFVNVKLTAEQDAQFDNWELAAEDIWLLFQSVVESGHKFSLAWNEQNQTFVASFTGQAQAKDNAGYTLSAFAANWFESVSLLVFKHEAVCGGKWQGSEAAVRGMRG